MATVAMKFLAAAGAMVALSACAQTTSSIPVWDHPLDVRNCRKVATISPATSTAGGFGAALAGMKLATVSSGGTDLLLQRDNHDWSMTTGVAYDCRVHDAPQPYHAGKIVKY